VRLAEKIYVLLLILWILPLKAGHSRIVLPLDSLHSDSVNSSWSIGAGLDFYWGVNALYPKLTRQPTALYAYSQNINPNLNLGYIQGAYSNRFMRASLGLMAGVYAQENLSHEPQWARFILEANIGFKLHKTHKFWLDMGVMPSHIGFESAISANCETLTRSLAAENSPYYINGLQLSWESKDSKWNLSLLVMNGWQRIAFPNSPEIPAFGHKLQWSPHSKLLLSSSSYAGKQYTNNNSTWRIFHNFYAILNPIPQLKVILGADTGIEEGILSSNPIRPWYSILGTLTYSVHPKITIASRAEWHSDVHRVLVQLPENNPAALFSTTLGAGWKIHPRFTWRAEARWIHNTRGILTNSPNQDNNVWLIQAIQFML
jgi:hypothetical protein